MGFRGRKTWSGGNLLTSMDKDGTKADMIELTKNVSENVKYLL